MADTDILTLRDRDRLSWPAIAAALGLGSKDAARRAYLRAKGRVPTQAMPDGPRSLARFVRDKRREGCPVCTLDADIRRQLAEAGSRKIPRAVQLEWLRTELKARITDADLTQHVNGRHDAEAA